MLTSKCLHPHVAVVCLLFFVTGFVHAQDIPQVNITVEVAGAPLSELLDDIGKKSGISFSYNPKKIDAARKVTYRAADRSLGTVLDELATRFDLSFTLIENQLVIKPRKGREKEGPATFTLSGTVTDAANGEALIGATLYIRELQTGTVANAFGFFSMTIPKGTYTISCTFIGYAASERTVQLQTNIREDIALKEDAPLLEAVVVQNTLPDVVSEIRSGNANVRPASVQERPSFMGEVDVLKSLESLPGVKLHSDGSTFYYVRGGDRDQNMVLVDDAPIYNPTHMLGLFSTIIPDAVNDITMYKGDMPASLGGRLSSVLDIRTKKGNDQNLEMWGNAGLISTKVGVEGPIKKDASSFLVSTRFSRLKWILDAINPNNNVEKFNFYDVTGKVNVRLNTGNRMFFSFYTGADNYFGDNRGLQWKNNAMTIRWNHLFSERLFLNTTFAASNYDYSLYNNVNTNSRWTSQISNFTLKTDFSYFIRPENELTFGCGINGYSFNPGNLLSDEPVPARLALSVRNSGEFVLYGNHEVKFNERWGINYGIRLTSWSNNGEAFEFRFNDAGEPVDTSYFDAGQRYITYRNAEPRLTVSYLIDENTSLKASYSRNVQNVHLISNSISPFTSLEVWLPSSINIRPQVSRQASIGFYRKLVSTGTSLTAETFYKRMYNQIDYDAHAETLLNPLIESQLRFGTGTSYGIELLARKDEGRVRGWMGYTWSRAIRETPEINGGRKYNAFYDRPHQVNIMLSYDAAARWNVGMNWVYATGAPFSSPTEFYSYNGAEVPVYGEKHNDRLPDYHRLDLAGTFRLNRNPENKFAHSLSFSIYNFYARKNALFINYNKVQTEEGKFRVPADVRDPERVTSQYFLFRFTPSISYNFKWR
ncbi:MAG TPA: TonB-dependent receptor [Chryseosolibacter sp.]|nr:TonB-dependent receptor [Chryseosolibacter sp.]